MSGFHEVRLPTDFEGISGGPMFSTQITTLASGKEVRVQQWSRARRKFTFSFGGRPNTDIDRLREFYVLRCGPAYGFRMKDWSDYKVTDASLTNPYPSNTAQLIKTYSDSAANATRIINKPVAGTVTIKKNGVNFPSSGNWTLDTTTGIVTFTSTPLNTDVFLWSGEFDVPVRFSNDQFSVEQNSPTNHSVTNVEAIEIL